MSIKPNMIYTYAGAATPVVGDHLNISQVYVLIKQQKYNFTILKN